MTILTGRDPTREPSFSFSNRLARALWNACWLVLFRPSPRPLHAWRAMLLRLFGAKLGPHVHVYPSARIWAPWNLEIEGHVGIGDEAIVYNMAPIRIGHHATVSQRAHLCAGSHDADSPNFQLVAGPITIAPYAWVCTEAFVGLDVAIAEGCVVGARAVVTRNLDRPWTVYAGVPARAIRARRRPSGSTG